MQAVEVVGSNGVQINFDGPAIAEGIPDWDLDGVVFDFVLASVAGPNSVWILATGSAPPPEAIVQAESFGFRSPTGGFVTPGTYPIA